MADHPKIIRERSAGVIVYQQNLFGNREYLLLDYGRHWDFPKGHLNPGETDRAAAERELFEETGIRPVRLCEGFCREVDYVFRARGRVIHKTVAFFVAQVDDTPIQLSHEHDAFAWLAYDQAMTRLTYSTARDILRHADVFISQRAGMGG